MSDPQTIREHIEKVNAIADRIDKDWIPSRSSEALVLELRAIAAGGLDLLGDCEWDTYGTTGERYRLVPDPAPRGDADA